MHINTNIPGHTHTHTAKDNRLDLDTSSKAVSLPLRQSNPHFPSTFRKYLFTLSLHVSHSLVDSCAIGSYRTSQVHSHPPTPAFLPKRQTFILLWTSSSYNLLPRVSLLCLNKLHSVKFCLKVSSEQWLASHSQLASQITPKPLESNVAIPTKM